MHPLIRFAGRNITKAKARSGLAIAAVFLGVLLITTLLVLTDSLVASVNDSVAILSGNVILQEQDTVGPGASLINATAAIQVVRENATGGALAGLISAYSMENWYMASNGSGQFGFTQAIGVVPSQERAAVGVLDAKNIVTGRTLQDTDGNATVIGIAAAITLHATPGALVKVGNYHLKVVGIFSTNSFLDSSFYVPFNTSKLFRTAFDVGFISTVFIKPVNVDAETTIINYVNQRQTLGLQASDVNQMAEQGRKFLNLTTDFAFYIGLISIVIGSLSVFNAILMGVSERKKEIAVLKATGWADVEVGIEVLAESIIIGSIGGLFGLLGGIGVSAYVAQQINALNLVVQPLTLLRSFIYAVLLGIIAGLYPALRAMRIDPVVDLSG